jgi:hypothetical protein
MKINLSKKEFISSVHFISVDLKYISFENHYNFVKYSIIGNIAFNLGLFASKT